MSERLFDSYVMVDWSAASVPTRGADSIWIGIAREAEPTRVENLPTRAAAIGRLVEFLHAQIGEGRRTLAGFDFPFGYPVGVAEHITGEARALSLWDWIAERVEDGPDNTNNRFEVASEFNRRYDGIGPYWGRPESWDFPDVPPRKRDRHGTDHPREFRSTERAARGAKSVWQLAYAGSGGSQVLLGLPALNRLRRDPRIAADVAVWPFETGLRTPARPIVLAEIYPSLMPPDPSERIKDAGQVRAVADWMAAADRQGELGAVFEGPCTLPPADRAAIATEEAWILGATPRPETGGRLRRRSAGRPPLRYERDPAEIYRRSFEAVRAEARLDHLPDDLRDVAVRLVHACGMTDLPARLAWSADLAAAAKAALAAGAPVLCDCEMLASGIVRGRLPAANPVVCTLNDPRVPALAREIGNTRSAAAVEFWCEHIAGAVVAIGNAPTALFHLLELLDRGWPRPAAILGFPVGFVGAAESKAALARDPRGVPYLALRGRRGGSALAAAAVNALAAGLEAPR